MEEENPRGPVPSPRKIGFVVKSQKEEEEEGTKRKEVRVSSKNVRMWTLVHTDALYIEVAFARSRVMVLRASRVI